MAAPVLWELADLEAELSAEVVLQVLDDDNDGSPDEGAVERLQQRSAAYVISGLHRIYPGLVALVETWQADLTQVNPRLKDLALDMAVAYMAKRHAEYVRRDWKGLVKFVDDQLERIRTKGLDGLATEAAPEPATNQGGETWAGGDDTSEAVESFFNGPCGLGDF